MFTPVEILIYGDPQILCSSDLFYLFVIYMVMRLQRVIFLSELQEFTLGWIKSLARLRPTDAAYLGRVVRYRCQ